MEGLAIRNVMEFSETVRGSGWVLAQGSNRPYPRAEDGNGRMIFPYEVLVATQSGENCDDSRGRDTATTSGTQPQQASKPNRSIREAHAAVGGSGGQNRVQGAHDHHTVGTLGRILAYWFLLLMAARAVHGENSEGLRRLAGESVGLVEEFYEFLIRSRVGLTEEELLQRMPRIFDAPSDLVMFQTWVMSHEYFSLLLPQNVSPGKKLSPAHIAEDRFVAFGDGLQPLSWGEHWGAWVIYSSSLEIGVDTKRIRGFKQVMFRTRLANSRKLVLARDAVNVNGIILFDDMWNPYWFENFTYQQEDLWARLGIAVPWEYPLPKYPAQEFRLEAGIRPRRGFNAGLTVSTGIRDEYASNIKDNRLGPRSVYIHECNPRPDRLPDRFMTNLAVAVACGKALVSVFYENLLNDRPAEHCPDLFVTDKQGGTMERVHVDSLWRKLKAQRWWFTEVGCLTNAWMKPHEVIEDFIERPFVVAFKYPLDRRTWTGQELYLVYRLDPPTPPDDPLWLNGEPRTVRWIWFPVVRTKAGGPYRIMVSEWTINGILVGSLLQDFLPPAANFWMALGFPSDPRHMDFRVRR